MFVTEVKSHQLTFFLPVRKILFLAMVILFSFLQAGNKNDSIDSKKPEEQIKDAEIYIIEGTLISGVEGLHHSEIKIIKKDQGVYIKSIKQSLRKSQIAKKEKKGNDNKIDKERFENKIEISNKDQERKYRSWLFIELQATKENGQYKYDFSFLTLPVFFESLPSEKTKIYFFRDSRRTFLQERYCCIRPPPVPAV